ncbi:MAG: hypothetical protein FWD83_07510 [Promicromonosporaceae bacterium]|nr:hypothetical protein [Promicromonosporaceae bacterium]
MTTSTVTVATTHDALGSSYLQISPGEQVIVGERSADDDGAWPAFVPINTLDGKEGWVPERYLSPHRPNAVVTDSYDTTELPAVAGETLELLVNDAESGWSWCRNAFGAEGWIPNENLNAD